ncbi:MAG: DUF4878 domain-containing protein [Prevotellaceae bacterium]|jgi:hypothetical protein|nr:DUF4878 domain-containing protein [Prevotellaceae bacterium]
MKNFKKLFALALCAVTAFHCPAQTDKSKATPRDVLAECYSACSNFNYDAIKECLSQRNIAYVDVVKQKFEDSEMKLQKNLVAATMQTAQYDIVEENISKAGQTATLKVKVSLFEQTFTADIAFVIENGKWKIDNVPNARDIPNQIPMLQAFIR